MKIGNGEKSERADRRDDQNKKKRGNDQKKDARKPNFSEIMNKKESRRAALRGDERSRRLKRGEVQARDRDRDDCALKRRRGDDRTARRGGQSKTASRQSATDGEKASSRPRTTDSGDPSATEHPAGHPGTAGASGGTGQRVEAVSRRVDGSAGVETPKPSRLSDPAVRQIAREILDAVRVGEDQQKRKVMFLDVSLPDQGDVRIRLRRDGGGMAVRMRADNDALARSLQEGVDDLRRAGKREGIEFTSVQVVR